VQFYSNELIVQHTILEDMHSFREIQAMSAAQFAPDMA
jgi:hypothetical protein